MKEEFINQEKLNSEWVKITKDNIETFSDKVQGFVRRQNAIGYDVYFHPMSKMYHITNVRGD